MIVRLLTAGFLSMAIVGGSHASEFLLYKPDTRVISRGPFMACQTPTNLDEYWSMFQLKAIDAMADYRYCTIESEGSYEGIVVESFDKYLEVTARMPSGNVRTFWTRKGSFKTEGDYKAADCFDKKGNDAEECYDLYDRDTWKD